MLNFRLILKGKQRQALEKRLIKARQAGDLWLTKRILSILNFADGWPAQDIASMLKIGVDSVCQWISRFLGSGVAGLKRRKSPGRPSKLTKTQRQEFAKLIDSWQGSDREKVIRAFRRCVARQPSDAEVRILIALRQSRRSWFPVVQTLMNLDETISKS